MYSLEIYSKDGAVLDTREITAGDHILGNGRKASIKLSSKKVDSVHVELKVSNGGSAYIRDRSGRGKGVWVAGMQLAPGSDYEIKKDTFYEIGDLALKFVKNKMTPSESNVMADSVTPERQVEESSDLQEELESADSVESTALARSEVMEFIDQVQNKALVYLDLHKRATLHTLSNDELRREAESAVRKVIDQEERPDLGIDIEELIAPIVAEAVGLGPLELLLADESITEIMVNGYDKIYVERKGKLQRIATRFSNHHSLMSVIERIVTPLGRRVDEGVPMVDARLRDGSRVNAIIPPLALNGATLTIRKFSKQRLGMQDLLSRDTLSNDMAAFLTMAVKHRCNIIVSGGTGSGKTTTLNILSNDIPEGERIVTVEDSAELRLNQDHVISLESRPPNVEGKGEIGIRELVKNCLRMRPDRIVVGECRGGEALDMLQAMNTGHDGSLTTGHANSPKDLLSRLEVMVLMSGVDLPVRAIREQIASAVDIVLQQTRFSDGTRKITSIVAIDGMEGDVVLMQKLFEFKRTGIDEEGKILGSFEATGEIPKLYQDLESAGIDVDISIFGTSSKPRSNGW